MVTVPGTSSVTVSLTVTDGRGGSGQAQVEIRQALDAFLQAEPYAENKQADTHRHDDDFKLIGVFEAKQPAQTFRNHGSGEAEPGRGARDHGNHEQEVDHASNRTMFFAFQEPVATDAEAQHVQLAVVVWIGDCDSGQAVK